MRLSSDSKNTGPVLVSACLCGIPCRYDGESKPVEKYVHMLRDGKCLPFCPEKLGGLTTPREPAEITGFDGFAVLDGKAEVLLRDLPGDVTSFFLKGAYLSVSLANAVRPRIIYLKERSPSCGLRSGSSMPGVAAAALIRAGFRVEPAD
ncbi:MAG: DUF523 domain-containing protein [Candidatus Aegiribacteria sp.]|nr:DUF523 domain-containing protein [Candidatus Aegiribacteria sp.]